MALFQRRRAYRKPKDGEERLGLVVPPKAIIIFGEGEVIFDGVAEMERLYRMQGRPNIVFEEGSAEDVIE